MSDPVSNNEIEDVLSSIRRLVSDDAKGVKSPDRLVLTPSQRIPDEAGTAASVEPDSIEQKAESDLSALASIIGEEVERALHDSLPSDETDADFDIVDEAPASALPETAVEDPELEPVSDSDTEQPAQHDVASEFDMGDSVLEQKIAALEQLVAQKGDEWEQDTDAGSAPMFQHNPARSLEWSQQDDAETTPVAPVQDTASEDTYVDTVEPDDIVFQHPVEKAETPVAEQPEEPEDSPNPTRDDSKVTPFILHAAPDPEDDPSAIELANADTDLLADNTIALDEEALREMVGEMVRRELQGALGERITRNVRKLVRREIHRAMVAREFD